MYHTVTPDPALFEGVRNLKTGEQAYYRKISSGKAGKGIVRNKFKHFGTNNPSQSTTMSKRHKRKYGARFLPALHEVRETTGHTGWWGKLQPEMVLSTASS